MNWTHPLAAAAGIGVVLVVYGAVAAWLRRRPWRLDVTIRQHKEDNDDRRDLHQ